MKRALYILLSLLLFSCTTNKLIFADNNIASKHTVSVPDDYPSIQEAIKHAKKNDVIYIKNGIYRGNIVIDKEVSLIGQSPENVILIPDEDSNKYGITIKTDNIDLDRDVETRISKKILNISISSLQIRYFEIGIELAYYNILSIRNCIIVSPQESTSVNATLWLQGAKTYISNCILIGEVYIYDSICSFKKNIIVNRAIKYGLNKYGNIDENAINAKGKGETSFIDNIIWGNIEPSISTNNTFINPQFENVTNSNYISAYTKDGYGADIQGISSEKIIVDSKIPEIVFREKLSLNDINVVDKQAYNLNFIVYDDSPIKEIVIETEKIDCSKEFLFQRMKYKKEVTRLILLQPGYNTVNISAEDIYGNKSNLEINLLFGEYSIPKSDWNSNIKNTIQDKATTFKNRIGLVIGIQKYAKEFPKLKYTENDAKSMFDILSAKGYKMLSPLYSPTLKQIKDSLIELEKMETENDKVVIYISGHGSNKYSLFSDSNGLILASDSIENELSTTALPIEDLRSYIKRLKAKSVVIILDMCFAGSGKGYGEQIKNENINYITETLKDSGKGKILLASSGDMEESYEDDDLQHGVFTYYLIEAIKNDKKSIDSIYEYVYNSIEKAGKYSQRPRKVFLSDDVQGIHLLF